MTPRMYENARKLHDVFDSIFYDADRILMNAIHLNNPSLLVHALRKASDRLDRLANDIEHTRISPNDRSKSKGGA